jgi:hypothetical protein
VSRHIKPLLLATLGAAVGGAAGVLLFRWLYYYQAILMPLLPGAGLGFGCSFCARRKSSLRGVLCGILGVVLGLVAEWSIGLDKDIVFFVTHIHKLGTLELVFIVAGGLIAFWIGGGTIIERAPEPPQRFDSHTSTEHEGPATPETPT